jgi:hypothetical protein
VITPIRWATLAAAPMLAMGCSDAISPPHTSSALARHIDSLVVAARSSHRDSLWAYYLEGVESVPAYGGTPTSITVTTHAGTQTWQGFVLTEISTPVDTAYVLWAYSDETFSHFVAALLQHDPSFFAPPSVYWVSTDSLVVTGVVAMNASTISEAGGCSLTSGLENYHNLPPGSCSLGTSTVQLRAPFPSGLDTLALGPQRVSGVVLQ